MDDLKRGMMALTSGMKAQSLRLRLVSENIANADVPGFRRKLVSFGSTYDRAAGVALVEPGRVRLDPRAPAEIYEPGHPLADAQGMRVGSNVDPIIELADAREAHRGYEASVSMFDQARRMRGAMLDLLRR
ncbi:MAG: flagellar basal body protein [Pseudomonadota bacterium]